MKCFVLALILASGVVTAADSDKKDSRAVTVKGHGVDEESALNDALRKAVEEGGKIKLYSESKTENYELVKDTILAQASGMIKEYKILKKGASPLGGHFVQIKAVVDRKMIDATWAQVEILLKQLGRPKILVSIVERIYDTSRPDHHVERVDADSMLASKIEQLLVEKGFALVDKGQIDANKQAKLKQATIDMDNAAMKRLAAETGAQMYIVGNCRASGPQISKAYGVKLYMWETDLTIKAYWAETAGILFAENKVGDRSGSRVQGPPGAKKAIAKSGDALARKCLKNILAKWSKLAVGGGNVVLEIKGAKFKQVLAIQKALKKIKNVKEVRRKWNKPVAKFEIITKDTAEKFVEHVAELEFKGFALDIESQKFNTIIATVENE